MYLIRKCFHVLEMKSSKMPSLPICLFTVRFYVASGLSVFKKKCGRVDYPRILSQRVTAIKREKWEILASRLKSSCTTSKCIIFFSSFKPLIIKKIEWGNSIIDLAWNWADLFCILLVLNHGFFPPFFEIFLANL